MVPQAAPDIDPLGYYDLERYLFENVHGRFHSEGSIGAFDLFSIIIWKANRAKSKIAHRLRKHGELEAVAREMSSCLFRQESPQQRLLLLMDKWGFRLPMASAILTVLWPEEFTVYDIRVCEQLKDFQTLGDAATDRVWDGFCRYREAVKTAVPHEMPLRDKDRFLWGRSARDQLANDLRSCFVRDE